MGRPLLRCLLAAGVAVLVLHAGTATADPPAPRSLDGAAWEFRIAGGVWAPATLPHVFDPTPTEESFAGETGDYRLRLRAPSTSAGYDWGIRFEQIRRTATIALDGRVVATHGDPYAPFTVPLPGLGDGREHELTIHVDNRKGREPREGWWNWGGITRPATLVPLGAVVTRDPGFLPRRRCDERGCRWSVLVDARVEHRTGGTATGTELVAGVRAPDGTLATRTVAVRPLAAGESARVRFEVPVAGRIDLWGPGHPALYRVSLQTRLGGALQQSDDARIGLRWVGVEHGLLTLNGRALALRGASIQEDMEGRGPALTDEDIETIVRELKGMGANVTRAHYALDERLLRRLDEEGILVWSQAPIYHRDRLLETGPQRDAALATLRATVRAVRNHPSVITHSVANELSVVPDDVPGTRAYLDEARRAVLDLDPTLPTSVDTLSYPGYPRQETYARFDLLGINSYFGWYPGKANHSTADLGDLGPYLASMRTMYPRQGLVVTEFGAEATYDGPGDVKETYGFQENYVASVIDAIAAAPTISGAIYWTLREFAVKPGWDGGAKRVGVERDAIHNKGLITYDGRPKPAYDVLRDDIKATSLARGPQDVARAIGIPLPDGDRGIMGAWLAVAIVAGTALFIAADVWAVLGWIRATRDELEAAADPAASGARAPAPVPALSEVA